MKAEYNMKQGVYVVTLRASKIHAVDDTHVQIFLDENDVDQIDAATHAAQMEIDREMSLSDVRGEQEL